MSQQQAQQHLEAIIQRQTPAPNDAIAHAVSRFHQAREKSNQIVTNLLNFKKQIEALERTQAGLDGAADSYLEDIRMLYEQHLAAGAARAANPATTPEAATPAQEPVTAKGKKGKSAKTDHVNGVASKGAEAAQSTS